MKNVIVALVFVLVGCSNDWQKAEQSASEYVKKMPGATGEVDCAHKDSDSDGYCSCSAFMKDGSIQPLECGCEKYCINCAEGCKIQLPFKGLKQSQ
jgi:hypothetical protein